MGINDLKDGHATPNFWVLVNYCVNLNSQFSYVSVKSELSGLINFFTYVLGWRQVDNKDFVSMWHILRAKRINRN